MGCHTSRPKSARSWEAAQDFAIETVKEEPNKKRETVRVRQVDIVVDKKLNDKTPQASLQESRNFGDGRLGVTSPEKARQFIEHVLAGHLFEDKDFSANSSSLAEIERKDANIKWKRPFELTNNPMLLVDGISSDDIEQGNLGDCWFLSSCAAIAKRPQLMNRVVPTSLPLVGEGYKGLAHFRFFRFGEWVDVIIDDRLPATSNRLIYAHSIENNEFWVALIEKAYAKLHGSYAALEGGQAMDALVDLTGGLAERYEMSNYAPATLYHKMARAAASGAGFITCSRNGDWRTKDKAAEALGLIAGHAYTVTDVKTIKRVNGSENLVRVRNPWGTGDEWKGAWCDSDDRWNLVSKETKQWLGYRNKKDGEWWMALKDFMKEFQEVTICTLGPDFDGDGEGDTDQIGSITMLHGKWEINKSAGGSRNDIQSFAKNPQFLLTVTEADERYGTHPNETQDMGTCSVVIGLMQEHRRSRKDEGVNMLQIGFIIYQTEDANSRLMVDHFMYNYETCKSGTYVNFREVCGRFEFKPGYYVIIPTTYIKNQEGTFMLRVYSSKSITLKELPSLEDAMTAPPVTSSLPVVHRGYDPNIDTDYDAQVAQK